MRAHNRQLAAIAAPAPKEATSMPDQVIDAVMARSIHGDAVRTHPLAAWVIVRDQIDYSGKLVCHAIHDCSCHCPSAQHSLASRSYPHNFGSRGSHAFGVAAGIGDPVDDGELTGAMRTAVVAVVIAGSPAPAILDNGGAHTAS